MSRVLVVGAGGLGCPALLALLARGVGTLGIMDPDRVELSNLHRQILYRQADLGRPKVEAAAESLERLRLQSSELQLLHPQPLSFQLFPTSFGPTTPLQGWDLVLDGTDRFETKLALSDRCHDQGVPYVFAGVVGYDGQVLGVLPGRSACPRCLFDEAPPPGAAPTCETLGILGPLAGIVAAEQVRVGLSLLSPEPIVDRLYTYDGRRHRVRWVPLSRMPDCRGCGARQHLRGVWDLSLPTTEIEAPELDLRQFVCPQTFVLTRKALEPLAPGARLWVRLKGDEAARSVPASVRAAGHGVLALISQGEETRVLLQRQD